MTIKIDHLHLNSLEDPGYWYLWALDYSNAFRFVFAEMNKILNLKEYNIDNHLPLPSSAFLWHIYAHALELYMKTFLIAHKEVSVKDLKNKYSHDLERLRSECAKTDKAFESFCLKFITQKVRNHINMDWESIKYPFERQHHYQVYPKQKTAHVPGLFGKQTMIPPLDLLESVVKPLVYIKD